MMALLAKAAAWITGSAMTPILIVTVLVLGGKYLDSRRAELVKQGENKCVAEWQVANMAAQRDAALANAAAADSQAKATEIVAAEIRDERDRIAQEIAAFRSAIAAAPPEKPGCPAGGLSDRVRDLARGVRRD